MPQQSTQISLLSMSLRAPNRGLDISISRAAIPLIGVMVQAAKNAALTAILTADHGDEPVSHLQTKQTLSDLKSLETPGAAQGADNSQRGLTVHYRHARSPGLRG